MNNRSQAQCSSTKTHEHDIEDRARALALWQNGNSYRVVGKLTNMAPSTVQSIVLKFQETGSVKNKARIGGPKKLKAEDREILRQNVLEDRESRTMSLAGITMNLNNMLTTDVS